MEEKVKKNKKIKYNYKKDIEEFENKHGKIKFTDKLLSQYEHCTNINNKSEMTDSEYEEYLKDEKKSMEHVKKLLGTKKNVKTAS